MNINEVLTEYVQGLEEILENNLKDIILYGSYARGEQLNESEISDIDIMILVYINSPEIENRIIEYSYEINLKYNILLSPIVETAENYISKISYIPFYKNVQKEGVILNGR